MKIQILEIATQELYDAQIRKGDRKELPNLRDGWTFDFKRASSVRGTRCFVLVRDETPETIEGCMVFSLHESFGPYLDFLEVAPHNFGSKGKYDRVAGSLMAFACGLSFELANDEDKGFLVFEAYAADKASTLKLEDLYREKYKAIKNPYGLMEIDPAAARALMVEYLHWDE